MVAPIYIIAAALGTAFTLGLLHKTGKTLPYVLMTLALGLMTFISLEWLLAFLIDGQKEEIIYTAGFKPPFSISLLMGKMEAVFISIVNTMAFLGSIYMARDLKNKGVNSMLIYLLLIMGLNVVIMTRDIFNLFVFLEVSSIATAGLLLIGGRKNAVSAGLKYLIATGTIAGFLLIGIIFFYYYAGSLSLDDIIASKESWISVGNIALLLVLLSVILELKPFPANGWALDVYQGANPGIGAIISASSATAMVYVLYKMMPLASEAWNYVIIGIGLLSFVASNIAGIKQTNAQRLLGYSSVGQIGLAVAIVGMHQWLGSGLMTILLAMLASHFLAKAGLFWLAGIVNKETTKEWGILRNKPVLLFLMGTFIFALLGFPPFPSFFGKWELIMSLSDLGQYGIVSLILIGSLFEAVYMLRWLGYAIKEDKEEAVNFSIHWEKFLPVGIVATALYAAGYFFGWKSGYSDWYKYMPLAFAAALFLLDFLPVYVKNSITLLGMGWYFFEMYTQYTGLKFVFFIIFIGGGLLIFLAGYYKKGKRVGFYPLAILMYAGLALMLEASNMLEFFFAWEIMTAGSYFLIIRGKKSMTHALNYALFSIGGAFLILAGFGITQAGKDGLSLELLYQVGSMSPYVFILLAIGFMTKTASMGLHIWLPGAHAEAETDVSPMVSAVLLKAGVYGLIITMISLGNQFIGGINIQVVLAWIGVLTALMGNMMAAFQEDAKRLLAYSSIGQLGYVLFGLALMSHLGWLTAISVAINHFLFKAMLFLAIGGVVLRTKTKYMYQMGGLIKKMPITFIVVLIGIITLSGVPPLSGFAGKWLFYNAILEKGWYLQGAVLFFAGVIAFLYCFRLIHTIFLGQLKDEHRKVKEAPFWLLLPQILVIVGIMVLSAFPNSILKPLGEVLYSYFPEGALSWNDQLANSIYGYWDGKMVLYVVVAIFASVFLWALIVTRKSQKVKQFNIVYAAERPFRPETTHFAYNFFAPFKKALGFLVYPGITNFWNRVGQSTMAGADALRKIYNGNGQAYVLHIVLFFIVVYFITAGGF
ncbi:MAG: NADH-quinone oxidoreductase subunit F [Marinilabiliales bacterium]|nr:MAG: NADH-quinone oxidoreductase subunit F [Marinilabiliales bacterium]